MDGISREHAEAMDLILPPQHLHRASPVLVLLSLPLRDDLYISPYSLGRHNTITAGKTQNHRAFQIFKEADILFMRSQPYQRERKARKSVIRLGGKNRP